MIRYLPKYCQLGSCVKGIAPSKILREQQTYLGVHPLNWGILPIKKQQNNNHNQQLRFLSYLFGITIYIPPFPGACYNE